ncbi:MAG: Gfo/Idh/MocA family oxidoreductase [Planctomycetes bacterium]|nr:Gfo/Idh/MocA family oxidoreductase [Planctomycetota bacterium]
MAAIGIIGTGNISGTHARAARAAGLEVAAVYGRDPSRTAAFTAMHGGSGYSDLDAFLRHPGLQFVAIGTPSALHAEHGIAAARRGLHVLVEKPIDVSANRADALIAACAEAEVRLGVFFQERFAPGILALRDIIGRGVLGRPILVSARVRWCRPPSYYASSTWRGTAELDGGGVVVNQGIHTLDTLLHLLGPVASVHARSATALHAIATEDTVVATLEFATGALGTFECTTSAHPGYPRRIEITGTEGTAIIDGTALIALDLRSPTDARPDLPAGGDSRAGTAAVDADGHRLVFEDFLAAIASGRPPRCDGSEGRRSIALVEALYESARSGIPAAPDDAPPLRTRAANS